MINHIFNNPLDPWSWIAILVYLGPILVVVGIPVLIIYLFRKLIGGSRSDVSNPKPSSEPKSLPEELKTDGN
jgi:hypothetical protein